MLSVKIVGIDKVGVMAVAIHVAKVSFTDTRNQRFGLKCVLEGMNCWIGWVSCGGELTYSRLCCSILSLHQVQVGVSITDA